MALFLFLRETPEVFFASFLQIYSMMLDMAFDVACNAYYMELVEYRYIMHREMRWSIVRGML